MSNNNQRLREERRERASTVQELKRTIDDINKAFVQMNSSVQIDINSTAEEIAKSIKIVKKYQHHANKELLKDIAEQERQLKANHAEELNRIHEAYAERVRNEELAIERISQERINRLDAERNRLITLEEQIKDSAQRTERVVVDRYGKEEHALDRRTKEYRKWLEVHNQLIETESELAEAKRTEYIDNTQKFYNGTMAQLEEQRDNEIEELNTHNKRQLEALRTRCAEEQGLLSDVYTVRRALNEIEQKQNKIMERRLFIFKKVGDQFNSLFDDFAKASPLFSMPTRILRSMTMFSINRLIKPMFKPSRETAEKEIEKDAQPGFLSRMYSKIKKRISPDRTQDVSDDDTQGTSDTDKESKNFAQIRQERQNTDDIIDSNQDIVESVEEAAQETARGLGEIVRSNYLSLLKVFGAVGLTTTAVYGVIKAIEGFKIWQKTKDVVEKDKQENRKLAVERYKKAVERIEEESKDAYRLGVINKEKHEENLKKIERFRTQQEYTSSIYAQGGIKRDSAVKFEDKFFLDVVQGSGEWRKELLDIKGTITEVKEKQIKFEKEESKIKKDENIENVVQTAIKKDEEIKDAIETTKFTFESEKSASQINQEEAHARIQQLSQNIEKNVIDYSHIKDDAVREELEIKQKRIEELEVKYNKAIRREEEQKSLALRYGSLSHVDVYGRERYEKEHTIDRSLKEVQERIAEKEAVTPQAPPLIMPPMPQPQEQSNAESERYLAEIRALMESVDETLKNIKSGEL